ncbi:MAG: glycosyltransferase family 39 protein [Deltaproteobacteria bacterium]|nr:glycosyltransferase family 39 protein [Deltaproteobacteria bacterium]
MRDLEAEGGEATGSGEPVAPTPEPPAREADAIGDAPLPAAEVAPVPGAAVRLTRALRSRWAYRAGFSAILLVQAFLAFQGLDDEFVRGHNGYNNSAFHQAARNSLRFGVLFPAQYVTGPMPPQAADFYTHHPLGMHLHNIASHAIFGDGPAATRLVPAVHGVLAVLALLLVVRRLWGPGTSLLAGAIYVALPINGIYVNMMNHSSGFILWSLTGLCAYVLFQEERARAARGERGRWGRWYALLLGATFLATAWDWPAYYVAAVTALHWLVVAVVRQVRARRPPWKPLGDFGLLLVWGLFVVWCLAVHLLLVRAAVGGWGELSGAASARQAVDWSRFSYTLKVVPPLMFTWTILVLGAAWLLWTALRLVRGRCRHRDLLPVPYLAGGVVHFFVFKWSTIVHEYWLWTTLPFFAVGCATLLVAASRWLRARGPRPPPWLRWPVWRERLAIGAASAVFLLLLPLAVRAIDLVPKGRSVGGSLWFVTNTRPGPIQHYDSGRKELRFAEQVRGWTKRSTGVLVHEGMDRAQPEPRFDVTLDREQQKVRGTGLGDISWPERPGIDGWVYIAPASVLPARSRVELAAVHPYFQYGEYVMVDFRSDARDVRIWRLVPQPMDCGWWFWHSAFEPPVKAVRDRAAEESMRREVETLDEVGAPAAGAVRPPAPMILPRASEASGRPPR